MEDVQRGGAVVEGVRGMEKLRWDLLPTAQGLTVAPLLHGALADIYRTAREREQAGDPESAAKELERAVDLADRESCSDAALWLQARAAQLRATARQGPASDAGYQDALRRARTLGPSRLEIHLQMSWAEALSARGAFTQARQQLERALRLVEDERPESPSLAAVLTRLGNLAERQDDLTEADGLYRRAYDLYRRAYDPAVRSAPGNGGEAAAANNLAMSTAWRGDTAQAELYAARALAIREKLTPMGGAIIPSLLTYGNLLYARGDLAGSETAFLRAKKILEKVQPESIGLAKTLHNLGVLALERGDDETAQNLFGRELALYEEVDPSGASMRDTLIGLGRVALQQRQGDRAEELWQRALAISEELNPRGTQIAGCLSGLAEAARLQGRSAEAEVLARQALAIWQEHNHEVSSAAAHLQLGILLPEQGDAGAAEAHLRTAICIREKYLGGPEAHHALARLQARRGQVEEAAATYVAAVDALEAHWARLGGTRESRWHYGSSLGDLYFEAAAHHLALDRPQEAWSFIERGRARGFRELLAQRDLRFLGELPANLYAERNRLADRYDEAQAGLASWLPEQGPREFQWIEGRLRDLRLELARVQERIRQSSPRLAALETPMPLDLTAARAALDPGTVLLTYAIGPTHSYLFVLEAQGVPGAGLSFHRIALGRADLAKEVEIFRNLLGRPESPVSVVRQRGRRLYGLLVRPAQSALARADRWLISPDGPLHALPFAALLAGDRYLAESKPIHLTASATVYQEIRAARPAQPSAALELLAVGDPLYPASLTTRADTEIEPQVGMALRRGLRLEPLPATRSEVEAISGLFPGTRILVGRDATEETIKALAPQARRLHFACHGLLDERFPLNSALALTVPEQLEEGRDNGLLQAWEIFEELRLDADLVTLSACDSGLGGEMGGEGLVSLARAFQFAGARSVLASLWSISDVSTVKLMKNFYTYLRQGRTKDEALRAAQLDLIRSRDAGLSHPYHWAGFALYGDWR